MASELEKEDDPLFAMPMLFNCPMKWQKMSGDERIRFCQSCRQNVYNLSAMTKEEALALIEEKEGKLCVRFYRRKDGMVITKDCASYWGKSIRERNSSLAVINATLAFMANILAPILGPSQITLVVGNSPLMARQSPEEKLAEQLAEQREANRKQAEEAAQAAQELQELQERKQRAVWPPR